MVLRGTCWGLAEVNAAAHALLQEETIQKDREEVDEADAAEGLA